MSSETEAPVAEAQVTNFIRNIIDDDLARGANLPRFWCGHPAPYAEQLEKGEPTRPAFARASRRSLTAICTSAMPRASV